MSIGNETDTGECYITNHHHIVKSSSRHDDVTINDLYKLQEMKLNTNKIVYQPWKGWILIRALRNNKNKSVDIEEIFK